MRIAMVCAVLACGSNGSPVAAFPTQLALEITGPPVQPAVVVVRTEAAWVRFRTTYARPDILASVTANWRGEALVVVQFAPGAPPNRAGQIAIERRGDDVTITLDHPREVADLGVETGPLTIVRVPREAFAATPSVHVVWKTEPRYAMPVRVED